MLCGKYSYSRSFLGRQILEGSDCEVGLKKLQKYVKSQYIFKKFKMESFRLQSARKEIWRSQQSQQFLRDREKIIDSYEAQVISSERKRCHLSSHPELDDALLKWFSQARTDNIQISGQQLLAKANKFGYDMKERNVNGYQNFDGVSVGYIDHWKSRNSICEKRLAGESAAVDEDNDAMVNWTENVLPQLLRQSSSFFLPGGTAVHPGTPGSTVV